MAERKYKGTKKQKAKKSTTGKYICPSCSERFGTRKDANKHQYEQNHSGAIQVQEVVAKVAVKKEEPAKISKSRKPTSPQLNKKRQQMTLAKTKYDTQIAGGFPPKTATANVAKTMNVKPNKITSWLQTLKGEATRREAKAATKKKEVKKEESKEPEIPEAPGTVYRFCRISEDSYNMIKEELDSQSGITLHINPYTENNLICCNSVNDYYAFDYMMFLHDFVEIELDIGDLSYILEYYSSKKNKLTTKLRIHDIAEKMDRWLEDVDDGGCITIGYDEVESLTVSQTLGRMGDLEKEWMACVGGSWDKNATKQKPAETKQEPPKELPAPKDLGQTTLGDYQEDKVEGINIDITNQEDDSAEDVTRLEELEAKDVMSLTEGEWDEYQRLLESEGPNIDDSTQSRADDVPLDNEKSLGIEELFEPVAKDTNKKIRKDKKDRFNQDKRVWNEIDGYGAEDENSYYGSYYDTEKETTPIKKGVSFHPVYGIDIKRIYTDRLIDIMKFHPPE